MTLPVLKALRKPSLFAVLGYGVFFLTVAAVVGIIIEAEFTPKDYFHAYISFIGGALYMREAIR